MGIIQEKLQEFLSEDENYLSNCGGSFKTKDFKAIIRVLADDDCDFVIFNNGGGRHFDIWFSENGRSIEKLVEHVRGYTYGYQLNKEQFWLRNF